MTSCCALLLCLAGWSSTSLGLDHWRDDVGYTKLIGFLGASAPDGSGVPISLVEAPPLGSTAYFPDVTHGFFGAATDPLGIAVNFIDGSGGKNKGNSNHAFDQARRFFGNTTSAAPGANQVTIYEANDYLDNVLNMSGSNTDAPDVQDFRVQNFSWIGTFATPNDGTPNPTVSELNSDREALRRFDYVIDANNITAVVGLNNSLSPLPHLLGQSYNSIAVGRSDGVHSTGLTNLVNYGTGRSKPDLVAPEASTSGATSITSSVATFLHSADTVLGTDAAKSQTMKAILMTGATKEGLPTWSQIDGGGQWRPLDDIYGAGELNLYNSYLVTLGGQTVGNTSTPTPASSYGWDYQTVQPGAGNELLYDFVIPSGSSAAELSIVLTWNAKIESPFHTGNPIVADLNLELVDDNGATIDFDINDNLVEGLSASDVDNVEHLYLTDLAAGTYTLKVSSDDLASEFGLAWRTSTLFDTASADFDEDGDTDGADFLAWQLGYGTLIDATRADGDADGDGDVDSDDLAFYYAANPSLASFISAVPEPATWSLAIGGLLLLIALSRRQAGRSRCRVV
ncbi:MAG: hypothetical protein GXP24_03275 [Planctomycetes bacterium]|nr:hypothetical protein [Planctomycetota bacterium]